MLVKYYLGVSGRQTEAVVLGPCGDLGPSVKCFQHNHFSIAKRAVPSISKKQKCFELL